MVADDVKLYHWLDNLLNFEEFETFQRQLIRDVLDVQHFGRVLILLTCFTRAGRLWRRKNVAFDKIEQQVKDTAAKLKVVLTNFNISDFMIKTGVCKEESRTTFWKFWCDFWKYLGGTKTAQPDITSNQRIS